MKLNVEGAELDVLEDLLDSGQFDRIANLLVMWDYAKIPELCKRGDRVLARVNAHPGPTKVTASKAIKGGKTATERFDIWFATTGAKRIP
jgi:hypothetical protein